MTLYLVRHAHKESGDFFNPVLRHNDQPLSERGREQARRLVDYFATKDIAALYVSEYLRTTQTAADYLTYSGLAPIIDARLNEIDNGLWDGMTEDQIREAYPVEWVAFSRRDRDIRFPSGETGQEAASRVLAFIDEVRTKHADQNVLAVSHEGLLRLLISQLVGLPVWRRGDFAMDFCSLLEIDWQSEYGRWRIVRFNAPTA